LGGHVGETGLRKNSATLDYSLRDAGLQAGPTPLILDSEIADFATLQAVQQAIEAQAHLMIAETEVAEAVADAAVFRQLASHADERLCHAHTLAGVICRQALIELTFAYFCNERTERQTACGAIFGA
jgi:hypothetical protein